MSSFYAPHVIVVDDGSTDSTGEVLQKIAFQHPEKIHIITLEQNSGKGNALRKGFEYALAHFDFESLVTLDGDTQHRPSDIKFLVQQIKNGSELVIGHRLFELMPFRSRIGNRIISFFLRCIYPNAPLDTQSGMRAFSENMINEIVSKIHTNGYEMEFQCLLLALSQHRRIKSFPITTIYSKGNLSSHFSPIKDSIKILKILFQHLRHR